jgi:hypothetical protein
MADMGAAAANVGGRGRASISWKAGGRTRADPAAQTVAAAPAAPASSTSGRPSSQPVSPGSRCGCCFSTLPKWRHGLPSAITSCPCPPSSSAPFSLARLRLEAEPHRLLRPSRTIRGGRSVSGAASWAPWAIRGSTSSAAARSNGNYADLSPTQRCISGKLMDPGSPGPLNALAGPSR